ncbi:MAG: FtsX-like permease family protein [Rectinema sp.]
MPVILRMAFRNIFEHKSKSLIIGTLLAVGALILVLGNSFIDTSEAGIKRTFTDNYTGDVFISGISEDGDVSLFGVTSPGGLSSTPTIPDYEKVLSMVRESPLTSKATGMATGFALVSKEENNEAPNQDSQSDTSNMAILFLFGIDATEYWNVFNSTEITAGKLLEPGQTGLVVSDAHLATISKKLGKEVKIGDKILIQGISSAGFRLRELPIVGTYHPKSESAMPEQMAFVDIDTLRVMAGMTVGANEAIDLKASDTAMLNTENTDALFGDDLLEAAPQKSGFDEAKIKAQLADTTARVRANTADTGAWQFIVVRTKKASDASALIKYLNDSFQKEGIHAVAGNWQKAAGPYSQSVDVVRTVFTIALIILAIVAILIIMNTFVISVIERTGEIGTMRAIGADKGFIRKLFNAEAAMLSLGFSTIGAVLATLVAAVLRSLKIAAGNTFFEILFGGKYLSLIVTPANFITAIVIMLVVGYLANLYPVSVALKIQPVKAMQNE